MGILVSPHLIIWFVYSFTLTKHVQEIKVKKTKLYFMYRVINFVTACHRESSIYFQKTSTMDLPDDKTEDKDLAKKRFLSHACKIDSTIHPILLEKLSVIRYFNAIIHILGSEELIPVGSSVDGSKVTVPGDSGDIDVLLVSNKVILNESLFTYSGRYPAYLHIPAKDEHEKYFKGVNLVDSEFVPVAVLKQLKTEFFYFARIILDCVSYEGLKRGFLCVRRHSAVGVEEIHLSKEALSSLGVQDTRMKNNDFLHTAFSTLSGKYLLAIAELAKSDFLQNLTIALEDNVVKPKSLNWFSVCNTILDVLGKNKSRCEQITEAVNMSESATDDDSQTHHGTVNNEGQMASQTDTHDDTVIFDNDLDEPSDDSDMEDVTTNNSENSLENTESESDTKSSTTNDSKIKTAENEEESSLNATFTVAKREIKKFDNEHYCAAFNKLMSTDFVPAFKVNGWPRVADEWQTRDRKWPTLETINKVIQTGCQVVAKKPLFPDLDGDPNNADNSPENDRVNPFFRLSFSQCELVLAKTLAEPQLLCWRVLKAYQKAYLNTEPRVLASYHWKNVLFWIIEETDLNFWTEDNVLEGVFKCLDFMARCLKERFLPYYFVRTSNLIDNCRTELMDKLCTQIHEIRLDPESYITDFLSKAPDSETCVLNQKKLSYVMSDTNQRQTLESLSEEIVCTIKSIPEIVETFPDVPKRFAQSAKRIKDQIISENGLPSMEEKKKIVTECSELADDFALGMETDDKQVAKKMKRSVNHLIENTCDTVLTMAVDKSVEDSKVANACHSAHNSLTKIIKPMIRNEDPETDDLKNLASSVTSAVKTKLDKFIDDECQKDEDEQDTDNLALMTGFSGMLGILGNHINSKKKPDVISQMKDVVKDVQVITQRKDSCKKTEQITSFDLD